MTGMPVSPCPSGARERAPRSGVSPAALLTCLVLALALAGCASGRETAVLRIRDWKTGEVYAEAPAAVDSRLYFGWTHSLENIPWNEYYHIDAERNLVLDAISFPAFGAGIPADRGRVCRVRDGLIHMEEIGEVFPELVWLNSHTATREIALDGVRVVRGADLPQHARVRLIIEPRR